MKAGGGVDIVGVNALVAITIEIGIQRTLIGAAVGENGEAWWRVVISVFEVRKTVPIRVALRL